MRVDSPRRIPPFACQLGSAVDSGVSITLLGEYTPTFPLHLSTNATIEHARASSGLAISADWVSTVDIDHTLFERYAGIWVAPGSPYRNLDKTLAAICHARENKIPCFGTCGGFQHMILEYARNGHSHAGNP